MPGNSVIAMNYISDYIKHDPNVQNTRDVGLVSELPNQRGPWYMGKSWSCDKIAVESHHNTTIICNSITTIYTPHQAVKLTCYKFSP